MRKAHLRALLFAALTVGGLLLGSGLVRQVQYRSRCAQVKQNLHAVQLALERYAVDQPDSGYPRDIRDLKRTGYLEEFPGNPFTGRPMRCVVQTTDARREDLEEVPAGAQPGDFMYFKRYGRDGQQGGDEPPQGYSLAAYF